MSRQKISDTKITAIIRMKELGFTVAKISEILKVSKVTVYDHTNSEYYKSRLERSAIYKRRVPAENKQPGRCELCKMPDKRLHYHAVKLEEGNPLPGLWLCNRCRSFCGMIDTLGASGVSRLMYRYSRLVNKLSESGKRNEITA